jgi:quercetin dioxygenase-like cupin family protein
MSTNSTGALSPRSRTRCHRSVIACVAICASVLAGCGDGASEVRTAAVTASPTPSAASSVLLGKGLIEDGVQLDTGGPAAFSVFVKTIPPGGSTGWHRHDGSETSIVTKGELTFLRAGACTPVVYRAGQGVFVPAGTAHLARNDGAVPAEVVVTYLLKPGAPDRVDTPAPC